MDKAPSSRPCLLANEMALRWSWIKIDWRSSSSSSSRFRLALRSKILGEWGAVAVALECGGAVDGLDVAVVGGVAANEACEVAEYLLRQTLCERGVLL
jgi:hypothetical protein